MTDINNLNLTYQYFYYSAQLTNLQRQGMKFWL